MKDIYGNPIKVGDTVKSRQPPGGILPPAPAVTGKVVELFDDREPEKPVLFIEYLRYNGEISRIRLEGKINEVILE